MRQIGILQRIPGHTPPPLFKPHDMMESGGQPQTNFFQYLRTLMNWW